MEQFDDSPNIDYLCSRLDNIQTTCTDSLKGFTLYDRTVSKETKADGGDIDKCFCSKTGWSQHALTDQHNQDEPTKELDVADIRGPCDQPDCRIARDMRYYIEDLAEEDNVMVNLDELVGPCGKTSCNFIKNLKDFICHRGVFAYTAQTDISKQCCCTEHMEKALLRRDSCESICSHECEDLNRAFWTGPGCVHKPETIPIPSTAMPSMKLQSNATQSQNVQNLYYLTVKMDDKPNTEKKPSSTSQSETKKSETKFKYCAPTCPNSDTSGKCTKSACDISESAVKHLSRTQSLKCIDSRCPNKEADKQEAYTPSPADSDVEINLNEIRNHCNVQSCDVADRVLGYIMQGIEAKKNCSKDEDDSCFCDCSRCKTNT